jgi:hypothetical protein
MNRFIANLIASLALPFAAYSADLSKDSSVDVVRPEGSVCAAAVSAPAPASAAGFDKLAFCSDLTQPEFSKMSDWLGGCGASNPKQWWLTKWFGTSSEGNCNNVGMVNDGGVQTFHMQYTTQDWANQANPNALYTCDTWSSPNKKCSFIFTAPIYAEITFRMGQPGLDNGKTDCSNGKCQIGAFWAAWNGWDGMGPDPTTTRSYEWDWLEVFHFGTQALTPPASSSNGSTARGLTVAVTAMARQSGRGMTSIIPLVS